jgi:hypothetical protein
MPLFEVCIVENPTRQAAEAGALETIVTQPKLLVARDSQAAGFAAVLDADIPASADRTRLEVLVRPFA